MKHSAYAQFVLCGGLNVLRSWSHYSAAWENTDSSLGAGAIHNQLETLQQAQLTLLCGKDYGWLNDRRLTLKYPTNASLRETCTL